MNERSSAPIGVFDSGMGGLTVLRALQQALPWESFIYLGDTARLPYGTKSRQTVTRYAEQAAKRLHERGIKALVVACNTASAVALPLLQASFENFPVFGVVEPGARASCTGDLSTCDGAGVLVLGTESTIAGGAYARAILRIAPHFRVWSRPCPLLVPLAEDGRVADTAARLIVGQYVEDFVRQARIQTILLGCTHYPVFRELLETLIAEQTSTIRVVDSAATTAAEVATQFVRRPGRGTTQLLATDGVERFRRVGELFLGSPVGRVELVDL